MKRAVLIGLIMVALMAVLGGCEPPGTGRMFFTFRTDIMENTAPLFITRARVTLTLDDTMAIREFTGTGNQITGEIRGLEPGLWTSQVSIWMEGSDYENESGTRNIWVEAGTTTKVDAFMEGSGAIWISVQSGTLPGYTPIGPSISNVLVDETRSRMYLVDPIHHTVAVLNTSTDARLRTLSIPGAPRSAALDETKRAIILGYANGDIYSIDLETGTSDFVCNSGYPALQMVAVSSNCVLVNDQTQYSSHFSLVDLGKRQVVDTIASSTPFNMSFNRAKSSVYYCNGSAVSRLRVDPSADDKLYGYWSASSGGQHVWVVNGGTRVVTGSGNVFTCSTVNDYDLVGAGSLGHIAIDLANDDNAGYIYLLDFDANNLVVVSQASLTVVSTQHLSGDPRRVFFTSTHVIVMVEVNGMYYYKAWAKSELGI